MENKSEKTKAPEDVAVERKRADGNGGPRKRRRRSGWDAPAPAAATTPAEGSTVAPAVAASPVNAVSPARTPFDPLAAQKLAYQKAQEILAQSGLGDGVPPPPAATTSTPVVATVPVSAVSPACTLVDPVAAQKLAFQKAQEILAQSGLGGGAPSAAVNVVNPAISISNRIYVGSLNYSVTEIEIRTIFGSIGPIRAIDMSFDPATQRSKGYCFVEFENAADAQAAIGMNGVEIAGRPVCDALF